MIEIADVVTGSNGAKAISSAQASGQGGRGQVIVTGHVSMRTLGILAVGVEEDLVPEPDFLGLSETRHSALPSGPMTQWREAAFDATASATWTTTTSWGAVGISVQSVSRSRSSDPGTETRACWLTVQARAR